MRVIASGTIVAEVAELCRRAAVELPEDVSLALRGAAAAEKSKLGRAALEQCLANAEIARREGMAICQDTGLAIFFIDLGMDVRIVGATLEAAVTAGVAEGYGKHYLRKSVVRKPLFGRVNTGDNTPPIIHLRLVEGDKLAITLAPKGAGSENMSAIAMLTPAAGAEGVAKFVVETVVKAGANPCPPTIVGVGIGGSFETAALLAKRALLRRVGKPAQDAEFATLEKDILSRINRSGIGPQGFGGTTTALAVHIEWMPCHIASLPVAVNLNCHAARHATTTI